MDINKLPERLFDLLTSNRYDELSEKDKNEIQAYLSPEEYNEMQTFVQQFSVVDQSLENSIESVLSIQENNVHEPKLWHRIINYSVPLYKVAATFLVFIGLFTVYQNRDVILQKTAWAKAEKNLSIEDWFYPEDLIFEL